MNAPAELPLPENLPASIRELVGHVGYESALGLVKAFPGLTIKVPIGAGDGVMVRRLKRAMGAEEAQKFIAVYGGERFTVPRCAQALRDARNRAIITAYDGGASVAQLALDYCLTERQIRAILKLNPGAGIALPARQVDDRQMGLF